jgi:dipeptide/tripeptide permease
VKEFLEAFKALKHAPRALWLVIFAFSFEMMAYYGVIPLMKAFLGQDLAIPPAQASVWVSVFTGSVSIVMLFGGKPAEDRFGIRLGIIVGLALSFSGRALYSASPFMGGLATLATSLVVIALGEGIVQPLCYAGVKRYTTEETSSMGFALIYSGLNFGAMMVGPISAKVRTTFDVAYKAGESRLSGFNAVNIVCTAITLTTLLAFALFMTKSVAAKVVRPDDEPDAGKAATPGQKAAYKDPRFLFFIFALLPVRTLFAHQWLTMPEYVLRSYPREVADRMEWLVDSVNPLVVFFGVATLTALTKRFHVLTMMMVGTLVSAASTFFLVGGPNTWALIAYFVVFSIGEALWSSRFYEYVAELAPKGQVAQYMGIASQPWFVAKTTTGLYSGYLLEAFVPKDGPQRTGTLWLIYGLFAMTTPISLWLARNWVRGGMTGGMTQKAA